ncbi:MULTISPECIES: hypothetical protein [Kitasatospora]|uniref:ABC transporter n=1 Tax=Kitasatospora cystarginea TaxID=58350 RepID=A0ABP5RX84_9ACTN
MSTTTAPIAAPPNAALPAPAWAVRVARLAALTALPSGLWRLALGAGIPVGLSSALVRQLHVPGRGTVYAIALSTFAEALAFLSMGLVRPWGQIAPTWLPLIGGRRIHPLAAVVPASLGALAVTLITWRSASGWYGPGAMGGPDAPHGLAGHIMTACYAPLLAWGPLLAVVAADYYRRSRRA